MTKHILVQFMPDRDTLFEHVVVRVQYHGDTGRYVKVCHTIPVLIRRVGFIYSAKSIEEYKG